MFDKQDIKQIQTNTNIVDLIVNLGAASSKREAREFIKNGSIAINGEKISDIEIIIDSNYLIDNTYIIVKRGKKNYYVGVCID